MALRAKHTYTLIQGAGAPSDLSGYELRLLYKSYKHYDYEGLGFRLIRRKSDFCPGRIAEAKSEASSVVRDVQKRKGVSFGRMHLFWSIRASRRYRLNERLSECTVASFGVFISIRRVA